MGKSLVIVESPAKAKTINKYLGKDYVVKSSVGHVRLRGVIVPILDMRLKFNMSDVAYDSQTVTIVLSLAKQVVGIVVDAVSDVVELKGEDIKPAPDFTGAIDTQQVIGIATIEQDQRQRMLILIDIEKLMSSAEMGLISQNEVAA